MVIIMLILKCVLKTHDLTYNRLAFQQNVYPRPYNQIKLQVDTVYTLQHNDDTLNENFPLCIALL